VAKLPAGAELLAENPTSQVQAFRIGARAYGVQFHPEFDDGVARMYVEGRVEAIRADAIRRGLDPERAVESARSSIAPTPIGPRLLQRFLSWASK
jgi:GMP synthase (glutamine-hydrolysing)